MRIRITQTPTGTVDGISLSRFHVGFVYDVGTSLGNYLMASRFAEPVIDDAPALVVPLDGRARTMTEYLEAALDRQRTNADERPPGRPRRKHR